MKTQSQLKALENYIKGTRVATTTNLLERLAWYRQQNFNARGDKALEKFVPINQENIAIIKAELQVRLEGGVVVDAGTAALVRRALKAVR